MACLSPSLHTRPADDRSQSRSESPISKVDWIGKSHGLLIRARTWRPRDSGLQLVEGSTPFLKKSCDWVGWQGGLILFFFFCGAVGPTTSSSRIDEEFCSRPSSCRDTRWNGEGLLFTRPRREKTQSEKGGGGGGEGLNCWGQALIPRETDAAPAERMVLGRFASVSGMKCGREEEFSQDALVLCLCNPTVHTRRSRSSSGLEWPTQEAKRRAQLELASCRFPVKPVRRRLVVGWQVGLAGWWMDGVHDGM